MEERFPDDIYVQGLRSLFEYTAAALDRVCPDSPELRQCHALLCEALMMAIKSIGIQVVDDDDAEEQVIQ